MIFIFGVVCLLGSLALAGPEPDPASPHWQLDFRFHDPQRIAVQMPGEAEPTTFWYLLFTVTNDTGEDVQFYPSFRLVTDTLESVEGGAEVIPAVYDAIAARHKKDDPFFAPPAKTTGPLLQGADNARTSAAVFRPFDPKANAMTVFVSGLSGEVARVTNPSFDSSAPESEANERFFILRKTLAISYDLPGDEETRAHAKPMRRDREWVMR
jgi:hypothetical protein